MTIPAKPYKDTLNLPVTAFEMKANLATREPKCQERWREQDLYAQIRRSRQGRPRRILHDGPPYANGEIHMGHLLNKVLKDVVVRSLTMRGFDSPYVPGWDCHGLPIEHKVMKDLGSAGAGKTTAEIRSLCHDEAMKWVGIQRDQFRRLGISGDWENPYLTLDPRYEAGVMDVLAGLLDNGSIFRQLKPIHWCFTDRTALAEAELEYADVTSSSIYVNFPIVAGTPEAWGPGPWHAMIWTTTPWTLPANVAIAVHPDLVYCGIRYNDPATGQAVQTILAADLVSKVLALRGIAEHEELGRAKGRDLENARYRHIFLDRESPIILAPYVSAEDGTGLVHTATGHGTEDYQAGLAYNLPTISPVDAYGRFTDEAPANLVGKNVLKANPDVIEMVRASGFYFHDFTFNHSYPHCWRCKKPVIFRATEQWFVAVDHDDLRAKTLQKINDEVSWHPAWGRSRIEAMVSGRPDWCISRQRSWGVPIPALGCESCDTQLLTADTVRHFRDLFRAHGADAWFSRDAADLLPPGAACPKCGGTKFRKEGDILDVWFESGSSHRAVLKEPSYGLDFPAYLYLEGSDQHRGWFQSSILTSVAVNGRAPFESVLTHGFIVDDKGKKMAKSGGNAISAVKMTDQYGADVLRLYVASLDYADDLKMSERGIKEASEAYRKIRNTFRYLLGNLGDYAGFDPASVDPASLHEIDRWALGQLNRVIRDVVESYERFELYRVYQRIYQFCAVDLSSFYLDVLKDRLYADAPDGPDRSAARFVLARLHRDLARLLAPIIPHTAEEIWDVLPPGDDRAASVHLAAMPEPDPAWDDADRDARWEVLRSLRDTALVALEGMRKQKLIGSAQEASITVHTDAAGAARLDHDLLATLCLVSEVEVVADGQGSGKETVTAAKSPHAKCERCWNLRPTVGQDPAHPTLCGRCAGVVSALPAGA
ncbi:isoleucine--tRNA ligase [Tundrisphaera sp. TA3]|uniref:isoleucine--tRNA ligase n=1 Tax=Tundrisphaera sp. TA3 TaxID=3435775 RepID=UPI003EBC680A